ncbi:hypothetical protein V8E36_009790 [Tilletia maclaganii]
MLLYIYTLLVYGYLSIFGPPATPPFTEPSSAAAGPTVHTTQATYIGDTDTTDGQPLDHFRGLRYARPPLGELRFQKPRPMRASNRTYHVDKYRASCLQPGGGEEEGGSEDCLFLNVIRPSGVPSSRKLPVMVWIHGGAFQWGSGSWDGSRLVAESVRLNAPIIFVSMNYRLGAFGFLGGSAMLAAAKQGNAALNAGMYDTRMALKWVQRHIGAFGGDAGRVTISGQSAGGFLVGNTLLSNGHDTGGLYHAAIMESGFAGGASTLPPDHWRHDQTFAQISHAVGCPAPTSDLNCIRYVPAARLAAAANKVTSSYQRTPQLGGFPYMPVQDFQVDGYWFSAPPRILVNRGQIASVPVIAGHNLDEGTLGAPKDLQNGHQFAEYVRAVAFADTSDQGLAEQVLKDILRVFPNDVKAGAPFYNEGTGVSAGTTDLSNPYFDGANNQFKRAASFYGAWRYIAPHRRFVQKQSANNGGRVWSYIFAQQDEQVPAWQGVAHGSELPYVYGNPRSIHSDGFYRPLSKTVQRAWISFVNFHDPRSLGSIDWPPYTPDGEKALQIKGQGVRVIKDTARADQLEFIKSAETAKVFSS